MGKGKILEHIGAGRYSVELIFDTVRLAQQIAHFAARSAEFQSEINSKVTELSGIEELSERRAVENQIAALQALKSNADRRLSYLQTVATPDNPIILAWCADLTEELSPGAYVGIAEIPGERPAVSNPDDPKINIRPGYDGRADYNAERDGMIQPAVSGLPASTWINMCLRPGVQKFLPQYRYGIITDLDGSFGTADVDLDSEYSTDQALNVNLHSALSDVPIEYMDCDDDAFDIGDQVLIEFPDRDWATPKIIGFRTEPRECTVPIIMMSVWSYYWTEINYPDMYTGWTTVVVGSGGDPSYWELRPNIIEFMWDVQNNAPVTYLQGPEGEYTLPFTSRIAGVLNDIYPSTFDDYIIRDPRQYITWPRPTEWRAPADKPNSGEPDEQFEAPPDYDDAALVFGQYLPSAPDDTMRGTSGAWSPKMVVHTFFQTDNTTGLYQVIAGFREFSPAVVHGDTPPTILRNSAFESYIEDRLAEVGAMSGRNIRIPEEWGGGWDDPWYYRETHSVYGRSQVSYIRSGRVSRAKITPP